METYNDIDGDVVNFFRVLRDQEEELLKAIGLTPCSREEFRIAINSKTHDLTELERARCFFIRARQARLGLAQTASVGQWSYCKLMSRAGMAGNVSRWLGSVEGLSEITQRLLRVQIENLPAIKVIQRYDSPETLFYCDPPYAHDSRISTGDYAYEMTDDEHCELAEVLHKVEGKVALSGYHGKLMNRLYNDWKYIEAPAKRDRVEVLWTNYTMESPGDIQPLLSRIRQMQLFPQKLQDHSKQPQ